jgi:hypothetical protein
MDDCWNCEKTVEEASMIVVTSGDGAVVGKYCSKECADEAAKPDT